MKFDLLKITKLLIFSSSVFVLFLILFIVVVVFKSIVIELRERIYIYKKITKAPSGVDRVHINKII